MTTAPKYTHGHAESVLRSHRWRTADNSAAYLLPQLRPGQTLLDIGAGPGTITADLADRVTPGRVTALEANDDALELSRAELGRRGIDADFVVGDVHALDLPDDSFDVVHAHQVLQHVADPVQALREMRRVCRPGGVVAARDSDYRAFAWYPQLPELDRWMELYPAAARANGGEPDAGRRLKAWAHAAGFEQVTASARHLAVHRGRRPRLLGRHVGGPDPHLRAGRSAAGPRALHPRRAGGDLGRVAGLDGRRGRVDRAPPWRGDRRCVRGPIETPLSGNQAVANRFLVSSFPLCIVLRRCPFSSDGRASPW